MSSPRAWTENRLPVSEHAWAPATIKISMKNTQELEIKVSYMSGPVVADEQQYIVNVYGFVPEQLTASEINIYPHLAQVMRLHTPLVALRILAEENAGGYLPSDLINSLHDKHFANAGSATDVKATAAKEAAFAAANQTLRLYGCVFRTSLRKQLKMIVAECRAAEEAGTRAHTTANVGGAAVEALWSPVSSSLKAFNGGILGVITRFQKESGARVLPKLPENFREAVNLVDEFLIFESIRALVKLLGTLDKALHVSIHSDANSKQHCHEPQHSPYSEMSEDSNIHTARQLVGDTIARLEAHLQSGGLSGSVLKPGDKYNNESFTYRQRVLKRHVRSGVSVSLNNSTPSFWFADLIGSLVSAFAMLLAVLSIILAQTVTGSTKYTVIFGIILIVGYVIKDRIKEWGKRYLEDFGRLFHVRFPDRIRYLRGHHGKVVGRCDEKASVISSSSVPKVPAGVRHANKGPLGEEHPAVQPERVIHYSKRVKLWWQRLSVGPNVGARQEGLDDVMVFDLSFLLKHMQPPRKVLARVWRGEDGEFGVEDIVCARVYHLHFIAAVKALAAGADDRSMALRHVKVIMDRDGIKRLEKDDTWIAQKPLSHMTRVATKLSVGTALKKLGSQQLLTRCSGTSADHISIRAVQGAVPAGESTTAVIQPIMSNTQATPAAQGATAAQDAMPAERVVQTAAQDATSASDDAVTCDLAYTRFETLRVRVLPTEAVGPISCANLPRYPAVHAVRPAAAPSETTWQHPPATADPRGGLPSGLSRRTGL